MEISISLQCSKQKRTSYIKDRDSKQPIVQQTNLHRNLMCNINHYKFPRKICGKNVHGKGKTVQCDLQELLIHIKCNNLNYLEYRYLQNCDESWYCLECCTAISPFNSLSGNKNSLACCTNSDSNITRWKDLENNYNSSLSLKSSSNDDLQHLLSCIKKTLT